MHDAIRFYDRALARMTRRQLLNAAWTLGAAAVAQPLVPARVIAQPLFRAYPFPLGVASGDPWPDSVVLWTRLAPEPLTGGGMPMVNVEVHWEIASDASLRTNVNTGTAIARAELGHSVHVEATGLQPGREYFWDQIRSNNPQILYHSARRGYIACTATPATLRADFKIIDSVTTPNAASKLGGSLVVEAGRPGGARA